MDLTLSSDVVIVYHCPMLVLSLSCACVVIVYYSVENVYYGVVIVLYWCCQYLIDIVYLGTVIFFFAGVVIVYHGVDIVLSWCCLSPVLQYWGRLKTVAWRGEYVKFLQSLAAVVLSDTSGYISFLSNSQITQFFFLYIFAFHIFWILNFYKVIQIFISKIIVSPLLTVRLWCDRVMWCGGS